jgi:type IV secretory pathway VirJ component
LTFAALRACRSWLAAGVLGCLGAAAGAQTAAAPQRISHGLFEDVRLFRPAGEVRQFVLLLSGADGFNDDDRARAEAMAARGAMVAGIAVTPFYQRLQREGGECSFANGAFENLARHLQAYAQLPTYVTPMLAGRDVGGTLAYAMLAQAAPGTFSAALTLGFCPQLPYPLPLCRAHALDQSPLAPGPGSELRPKPPLPAPWLTLQRPGDAGCPEEARAFVERLPQARAVTLPLAPWPPPVSPAAARTEAKGTSEARAPTIDAAAADGYADMLPAFSAAYAKLAERRSALSAPPASLSDLPVVEVPAAEGAPRSGRFAILLSGDGGWAGISQGVAAALAGSGIPVAGFDSLRYFWTARTPQRVADDLDRLVRYYAAHWQRDEVLLIGYSQGADVLPFALNRLPAATRARVRHTTLLALGQKASFEFHVANWIGPSGDHPVEPEASRLEADRTLCIYGTAERDSPCPRLAPNHAHAIALPGGHHFGGDYGRLADLIVSQLPPR